MQLGNEIFLIEICDMEYYITKILQTVTVYIVCDMSTLLCVLCVSIFYLFQYSYKTDVWLFCFTSHIVITDERNCYYGVHW